MQIEDEYTLVCYDISSNPDVLEFVANLTCNCCMMSVMYIFVSQVLVSDVRDPVQLRKLAESIAHCSSYAHDM